MVLEWQAWLESDLYWSTALPKRGVVDSVCVRRRETLRMWMKFGVHPATEQTSVGDDFRVHMFWE